VQKIVLAGYWVGCGSSAGLATGITVITGPIWTASHLKLRGISGATFCGPYFLSG